MKFQRITAILVAAAVTIAIGSDAQAKRKGGSSSHSHHSRSSSSHRSQSSGHGFKSKHQSHFNKGNQKFKSNHKSASKFKSPMKFNSNKQFKSFKNATKSQTSRQFSQLKNMNTKQLGSNRFSKNINKTKDLSKRIGKGDSFKKFSKHKNPGNKKWNPKHVKGKHNMHHNTKHRKDYHFKHKHHDNHWRHRKPQHCWWWYDWCRPLHHRDPVEYNYCDWNYVRCDYRVGGNVVAQEARWYLGVKGMILPGKGLGIEQVAPGSPAALAGLTTGMVIQQANGIDLVDEAALASAIQRSNGVLSMVVVNEANGQTQQATVRMTRLMAVAY